MEKDILDGKLGNMGGYDLEFKGGEMSFMLEFSPGYGVKGGLKVSLSADGVLDALAKVIPGQIDDVLLGVLKDALKSV